MSKPDEHTCDILPTLNETLVETFVQKVLQKCVALWLLCFLTALHFISKHLNEI